MSEGSTSITSGTIRSSIVSLNTIAMGRGSRRGVRGATVLLFLVAAVFPSAARLERVVAAFVPAARFCVLAAFFAAARRLVFAMLRP
jgi:hypothetical protein